MGLGTVELVMRIEEEFAISIPDSEASFFETMGALHVCILRLLRERGVNPNSDVVWERLRWLASEVSGIATDRIGRTAQFRRDLILD